MFATVWGPGRPHGETANKTGPDQTKILLCPVQGHFRTAGLSKDHYYAILINGPQGTVVDCRSPDKGGGDL